LKPIRAILFDLDGTLIDSTIAFHKMKSLVIAFLEQSGVQPGLLNKELLNQDIETRAYTYFHDHKTSTIEIRRIFTKVNQIMNDIELEAIETVQPYPDAYETLQQVSDFGVILGILTRGCREYAKKALEKAQFQRFFSAIAARDEVNHPKPDPEHAQLLLKRLKVHSSESLLVGDSQTDLLCAHNSNMRCVWLNRQNSNLPLYTPRPDYEISSLTYLPEIVKNNR
jgi:HAD superfamily hydrolase (TIGR01549 family)